MIRSGFLEVLQSSSDEQILPQFTEGQQLSMLGLRIREGQTSAPGFLTESELIGLMEKHGIGTDASIATHINNICERNYVSISTGRTLVPTALGIVLVHGYHRIDPDLVLPNVRAAIERFCTLIAQGRATKQQVVEHSLRNFEQKFRYFVQRIEAMDALFEATFSPLAATGRFLSKCGKCLRFMRYIDLKPQRLYCPTCNTTYRLPQNGTIKLYMEVKCPLDDFQLVLFSLGNAAGAQGKAYTLCPYCYNYPPDFDTAGERENSVERDGESKRIDDSSDQTQVKVTRTNMGCNQCMHPTCKFSAKKLGVCPCPMTPEVAQQVRQAGRRPAAGAEEQEGCDGMLVLDITSKPNWKLGCNVCNALIRLHGDIANISTLPGHECEECGATIMKFEFKAGKSPLDSGELAKQGEHACFASAVA
jgi:DNA topoisomerase-3